MVAPPPPISRLLLAISCIAAYLGVQVSGQSSLGLSCPSGFVLTPIGRVPGWRCEADPCFGNICGPGNSCTVTSAATPSSNIAIANCQCQPPYVAATVRSAPFFQQTFCYLPGKDPCSPNPCKNGASCSYLRDYATQGPFLGDQNTPVAAVCDCGPYPNAFTGPFCDIPLSPPGLFPSVLSTVGGVTGPIAAIDYSGYCSNTGFPNGCIYKDGGHYLCCSDNCGPYGPDGNTPLCVGQTLVPSPNDYPPLASTSPPTLPSGDQGVCGTGGASPFPVRCWFNSDPQGRYVCCDSQGCDGFNPDNLTPHCKNYGYVPPAFGTLNPPPPANPTPPSGDQGVCGTGAAAPFPIRCWFNSDPQGRYVCCDNQGCNGFNADNLTPHCQNYGYVPPGFGVSNANPPSTPPSTPLSGPQGVCGSGPAAAFPVRCWFNNDPQGRYVCCDNDGCNGFLSDNLFPHCKTNGYVPPDYGI